MRKSIQTLVLTLIVAAIATTSFAAGPATPSSTGVVNINTADVSQLALLPHVGAVAAQRIADYRAEHGPFRTTAGLTDVKGFGAKRIELLSAYVTVEGATTLNSKIQSSRKPRAKKPTSTASR